MAKRTVLVIQHAPWERAGRVGEALEDAGLDIETLSVVDVNKPELPKPGELAGLVLMGGPMRADDYEHHPGLKAETKLVKEATQAEVPVLGVCLGHQILARALGARLQPSDGMHQGMGTVKWVATDDAVSTWANKTTPVLQWHSDSASLPEGAKLLAKSADTKVEAFRAGSALGLQFHLEVTGPLFEQWLDMPQMVKGLKKRQIAELLEDFQAKDDLVQPLADSIFSAFAARCSTCAAQPVGE
ncbi:Glutamine amidotransferase Class I [Bifidobacterium actinocoloniiforme DSM 22766]|uniref:Glutamine amidotransferase Class I n=1 Tax=Bifidobacterium actinocoloniiforme DSM 22766 TaxID=1437605 RepID=A0A086Z252_9BIFI|nr:type 1 glutamine amidotransferase [Bifidobacterium actinocoloniiforme]AKV55977.1 GMP synthase [Bifidobacterium actinocoloniiforme DSM 22766]KFI40602.1 Glutamine amidotransferase Class I [Bifidobacterium actinocoloniiforme DSM 22766]